MDAVAMKKIIREVTVSAVVACSFAVTGMTMAAETPWPVRPVRIIVPQSAGGQTDLTARLLGPHLTERLGQPMVIDNRPGAGSMLGT